MEIERRFTSFREFRAEGDGNLLRGHFSTYGDPYSLGGFDEQIAPGAFDQTFDDDVRALFNHDPNYPLGRTKAGTLRISDSEDGPIAEIDLPESATMMREAIERGDVDQMSFGFTVAEDSWQVVDEETGRELRTITKIGRLFDVSPVTFPANPNTDIAMRSLEEFRSEKTETSSSGIVTESSETITEIVAEEPKVDAQFTNKRKLELIRE